MIPRIEIPTQNVSEGFCPTSRYLADAFDVGHSQAPRVDKSNAGGVTVC